MANSYWPDAYIEKRRSAPEAVRLLKGGQRVFIGSSCGEPQALVRELANQACFFNDIEIVRVFSLEQTPLTMIAQESRCQSFNIRSFYLGSLKPHSLAANKRFITPINLSAVPGLFKSRQMPVHAALIQASAPDDFGWMSLGISVDVTLAATQSADLVVCQVNPNMPRILGDSFIHVNDVDVIVEEEEPLLTVGPPPESAAADQIGRFVARLIEDGSTLKTSLGSTTNATLLAVSDKNDLGIHTQFFSDGILRLISEGVVTNRKKGFNQGKAVASGAIGSAHLYEFLHDNPAIEFHPSDYVNDPTIIARHNKMVSLNVALAIDLTGQVAADALPFNLFTGVSGIMDFVRGAAASPGGKSILVLNSTTRDHKKSRIVPVLEDTAVVVPRGDAQWVVTEYGLVNLFGKNLQERAMALISIAHPDFRDELFHKAQKLGLLGPERTLDESLHGVYPLQMEEAREVSGQKILFRPAKPVDERRIQEHFYSLNHQDVFRRFFHDRKSFFRNEMEFVLKVDYIREMTIVALMGEYGHDRVIGVGSYILNEANNMAEVAFSVNKDWQRQGIAGIIQAKLTACARETGIAGLVVYVSPKNQAMIKLFHQLPYQIHTSLEGGYLVLSARFDEPVELARMD